MSAKHRTRPENRRAGNPADSRSSKTRTAGKILFALFAVLLTAAFFCGTAAAISTSSQLQTALDKGGTVTLDEDIYGVAVTVTNTVTLNLNGHTLSGNEKKPVITIAKTGNLTVKGSADNSIINNNTEDISGCCICNNGTLNLMSGTLTGKADGNGKGGGVYNTGTFNMSGGTFDRCCAGNGGGVYNTGTFNMSGGTFTSCYADGVTTNNNGGGVYNTGTFNMSGGLFDHCQCYESSGGGCVYNTGKFTMSGGKIDAGYAKLGGGVYNKGTFKMTAGTITDSEAVSSGGGVYNEKSFTMSGGRIIDSDAEFGGGVYNNGKFTMTGGTITDDVARIGGGGVLNDNNCTFTMKGGSIEDCSASDYGGGVLNLDYKVNISGSAVISGNYSYYSRSWEENNIQCLADAEIYQTGNFTGTAGVTPFGDTKSYFGYGNTKYTGADHFFYDGKKLVGKVTGTKLYWNTPSTVTGVTVSGSTVAAKGKTIQLTAKATPSTANQNFTWKSDNESVATVSAAGKVTGKAIGTATITAVSRGGGSNASKTYTIEVKPATTSVKITGSHEVAKGKTTQLNATAAPSSAYQKFTWKSADTAVATVDSNGLVTGVAAGKTTITATAKDGTGKKVSWNITVYSVTIKSSPSNTVGVNNYLTLTASVTPAPASQTVTWKSSDKTIATVTSAGKVKGMKTGTAKITATVKTGTVTITKTYTVYVKPAVTSVKVSGSAGVAKGRSIQLKATASPSSAYQTFTWTSSDKTIASVNSTGKVTGVKAGTVKIYAKAKDGSGIKSNEFSVKVYANPVSSITLNTTSKSIKKGATFTLKATIAPTTSRYGGISWTSDNKAVATVDSKGVVTAKAKGTAVIKAAAKDGSGKYATCKITVTA